MKYFKIIIVILVLCSVKLVQSQSEWVYMDNMGLYPISVSFINTNTGWVAGYSGTKVHIKKQLTKD